MSQHRHSKGSAMTGRSLVTTERLQLFHDSLPMTRRPVEQRQRKARPSAARVGRPRPRRLTDKDRKRTRGIIIDLPKEAPFQELRGHIVGMIAGQAVQVLLEAGLGLMRPMYCDLALMHRSESGKLPILAGPLAEIEFGQELMLGRRVHAAPPASPPASLLEKSRTCSIVQSGSSASCVARCRARTAIQRR